MSLDYKINRREFISNSAKGIAAISAFGVTNVKGDDTAPSTSRPNPVPDKLVVLTLDDALKSHLTFVAPLLQELGFGATFFVTHAWMPSIRPLPILFPRANNSVDFLDWQEIAEIHQMGFEIGNHSWTHDDFSIPRNAARLRGELVLVENELEKVGVPRPVSFAYPGNLFGPEVVEVLIDRDYKLARRGMTPELDYEFGKNQVGPTYDPGKHHPLLIPSTGIADPSFTLEHFKSVVSLAQQGQVVVLQFHGVPDRPAPWVHTSPDKFRMYMEFLKEQNYRVIALQDVQPYLNRQETPADPNVRVRSPEPSYGYVQLPDEVEATRADMDYWLRNMLDYHHYTLAEASLVCGLTEKEISHRVAHPGKKQKNHLPTSKNHFPALLPYPGGRHPRIGFLEGALDPKRGTKASVFLPWDPTSYLVVDLPEAIFSNLGLIFLAHTHVPTVWNDQNEVLTNVDWSLKDEGSMAFRFTLPNGIVFGASIRLVDEQVEMELWLRNVTDQDLTELTAQICVLLKGAAEFNGQTNENKVFGKSVAAVRSLTGQRWVLTTWQRAEHVWGNPECPCMHSDPTLPPCPSGQTVRVLGRLWFHEGPNIDRELGRALLWSKLNDKS